MSRRHAIELRVYIEDTDAGGIVYYVNYLKYFERARTEFMRALGYHKPAFSGEDHLFVVTEANVRYCAPARLDDSLVATACVARIGAATLGFHQSVFRGEELLVDGGVTIARVDRHTGRPTRLPPELRTALAEEAS